MLNAMAHHASSGDAILAQFRPGNFTKYAQSNATCATRGEEKWAGMIYISDERRLFHWFFDSRDGPENDPIIVWTNEYEYYSAIELV
jgi:carboxypeptidase C (cathepsin A)